MAATALLEAQTQRADTLSRKMLQALLDAIPDTIIEVDRNCRVFVHIPAKGTHAADLTGRNLLESLSHEAALTITDAVMAAYDTNSLQTVEFHYLSNTGPRYFEARINKTNRGTVLFLIRDVTELKRREAEFRKQEHDLLQSNKDLEHFAHVASHDLKEPLRAMSGFASALAEDYADKLDATAREYIDFIVEGAEKMQLLIDDLLNFSRAGTGELVAEPTSLSDAVASAVHDLKTVIDKRHAEIVYSTTMPAVVYDPHLLYRVLLNLISNAIKFVPPGRVPRVEISCHSHDTMFYMVSVKDNGIGVPTAQQQRIFEPFKRLHHQDEYPGNGVGLSIVKRIVSRMGGQVYIQSTLGEGSEFSFTAPKGQQGGPT